VAHSEGGGLTKGEQAGKRAAIPREKIMHPYRTHYCGQLRAADVGSTVRISGWIHRKRDHGGVLFVDLRDHYGLTQVVGVAGSDAMKLLDSLKLESVVTVTGEVVARGPDVVNPKLATGEIEVVVQKRSYLQH
jgi:aspartyl-tRNA synthetase